MLGRLREVVGVERAQQRVAGHPKVEAFDQVDEEGVTPDSFVHRLHGAESRGFRLHVDSRP